MAGSWLIRVYDEGDLRWSRECACPLELGRQSEDSGDILYSVKPLDTGGHRIVIAGKLESGVSRQHARIEPLPDGQVVVSNVSHKLDFKVNDDTTLKPGETHSSGLPLLLTFGPKAVRIQDAPRNHDKLELQSLEGSWLASMGGGLTAATLRSKTVGGTNVPEAEGVARWAQAAMVVLQSAVRDAEFFVKAAQAMVELIGLDLGQVLLRDGDGWKTQATHLASPGDHAVHSLGAAEPPSRLVLNRVFEEQRTFWLDPLSLEENRSSLAGVTSVVAAPIIDRENRVVAVLYGERWSGSIKRSGASITRLEAVLVDLLATSVAVGLARLNQERDALSLQTKFEQFFTPELAKRLVEDPDLITTGRDQEISVLFCDVRGFSKIAGRLGPAGTLAWVGDVLSELSDCVLDEGGVLVDYIGDALMAMWGAPEAEPDHAERACRAAIAMVGRLPVLNNRWQGTLSETMGLTIGINTGIAQVGNTGSRRKFKYGALGDTVNVASRVQGAAKYFKTSLVITRATRDQLGPGFSVRRLGLARLVNIPAPAELFELLPLKGPGTSELVGQYEAAVERFQAGDFRATARILGLLVNTYPEDGPSYALMARAVGQMVEEPDTFDAAFRLPGK